MVGVLKKGSVVVVWMAVGWKKVRFGLGMVGEVLALQKNENKYFSKTQFLAPTPCWHLNFEKCKHPHPPPTVLTLPVGGGWGVCVLTEGGGAYSVFSCSGVVVEWCVVWSGVVVLTTVVRVPKKVFCWLCGWQWVLRGRVWVGWGGIEVFELQKNKVFQQLNITPHHPHTPLIPANT